MVNEHKELAPGISSLSISKRVPDDGANLAYIKAEPLTPENSISLIDYVSSIPENIANNNTTFEQLMYPNEDLSLHNNNGDTALPTDTILITDEFYVPEDSLKAPIPLYYSTTLVGRYKKNIGDVGTKQEYISSDIKIYNRATKKLSENEKYKIILEQVTNDACKIHIYANFISSEENTYAVEYPKYESGQVTATSVEIYNGNKFFTKVNKASVTAESNDDIYAIEDNIVYAPSLTYVPPSDRRRTPKRFKYQVEGNLKASYSHDVKGILNVGICYVGDVISSFSGITTLINGGANANLIPSYLELKNPHPRNNSHSGPSDKMYWLINPGMPFNQYRDYDLIIVTGYGDSSSVLDTNTKSNLKEFLRLGGKIWIDNLGTTGDDFLTLTGFPVGIDSDIALTTSVPLSFTPDNKVAIIQSDLDFQNRFHNLVGTHTLGYVNSNLSPRFKLTFKSIDGSITYPNEINNWDVLYKHLDNTPSIIVKRIETRGQVIISDCGLLNGTSESQGENAKLVSNILLTLAEDEWISSPWFADWVLNKDSLFPQEYDIPMFKQKYIDVYENAVNQVVAKKVLLTPREVLRELTPPYLQSAKGSFYVNYDGDVNIDINANGNEPIYAWTAEDTTTIDTILSATGYTSSDMVTYMESVNYAISISAHTYAWNDEDEFFEFENPSVPVIIEGSVNGNEGVKEIAIFNEIKPEIKTYSSGKNYGEFWADGQKTFYKIRPGKWENGTFIEYNWNVNILVRNKVTGEIMPTHYGKNLNGDWYWYFVVTKEQADLSGSDIAIYVYTKEYSVKGIKRRYSVKIEGASKIFPQLPVVTAKEPWYLKIHKGEFTKNIGGTEYTYKISEYDKQAFTPGYPYMYVKEERARYYNMNTIKVANTPVYTDANQPLVVKKMRVDGTYEDISDRVINYDGLHGLIELSTEINYVDNIIVSYYYIENNYYYKGYSDAYSWYLDLNPTIGHKFSYYDYEPATPILKLINGNELLNKVIYVYMLPYKVNGVITNSSFNIRHTFNKIDLDNKMAENPGIIQIATVMVREKQNAINNITLLDTRSLGGGLKESISNPLAKEHFWDISNWDIKPYYTNAAIVVELPRSILNEYNKDEVEKIVNKHVAYGTLVIIDYK